MPWRALEQETVLPALFVDIQTHVDIPALPIPDPARVRHLSIRDVDSGRPQLGILPGRRVYPQVPQRLVGEEGYAEDKPTALVLVEDVDVRVWTGLPLLRLRTRRVGAICRVVHEVYLLICHVAQRRVGGMEIRRPGPLLS